MTKTTGIQAANVETPGSPNHGFRNTRKIALAKAQLLKRDFPVHGLKMFCVLSACGLADPPP